MKTDEPGAYPMRDFIRAMQKEFGHCEYRAVSADGLVVQTPGWDSVPQPKNEVTPALWTYHK